MGGVLKQDSASTYRRVDRQWEKGVKLTSGKTRIPYYNLIISFLQITHSIAWCRKMCDIHLENPGVGDCVMCDIHLGYNFLE